MPERFRYFSAPEPVSDVNVQVYPNNSLHIDFTPPNDPENPDKKIKEYVIQYSSDDPVTDETEWKELRYVDPNDGDDKTVCTFLFDMFKRLIELVKVILSKNLWK